MRRILVTLALLAIAVGGYFAWKAEQPVPRVPSADWAASISSPDFSATTFRVPAEGAELEAMILLPNSAAPSGAVVFAGGSSDGLFQNYAPGFLKTYLHDIFLPRGIAVVYVNKRGMGASTGNWMNNTIEGRAADVQAVAEAVRAMPQIGPTQVGYAGHSQGGWVVARAGVEDPATAFVLNFMGPLRPPTDQFEFMWRSVYGCEGLNGDALDKKNARKHAITRFAMKVGRFLPIGMLEFDSKFFLYETRGLLAQISAPMLSVYGGSDVLVNGPANEAFLSSEFPNGIPKNLEAVTVEGLNHTGSPTPSVCASLWGQGPHDRSPKLAATIEGWLSRIGH